MLYIIAMSTLLNTPYGGFTVKVEVKNTREESAAVYSTTVDVDICFHEGRIATASFPMLCVGQEPTVEVAANWVRVGVDAYREALKDGDEPRMDQLMYPRAAAYALLTRINTAIKERSDSVLEFWQKNMD